MVAEVVIDSNVVLDWLLFEDASAQALGRAVLARQVRWIGTSAMADELADVLGRRIFDRWAQRRPAVLAALAELCLAVPEPQPAAAGRLWCTDADDQVFVDLALERRAAWLFTRDRALLSLARKARLRGLAIRSPAGWAVA